MGPLDCSHYLLGYFQNRASENSFIGIHLTLHVFGVLISYVPLGV